MDMANTIFIVFLTIFAEELLERFGEYVVQLAKAWRDKYREVERVI